MRARFVCMHVIVSNYFLQEEQSKLVPQCARAPYDTDIAASPHHAYAD